MADPEGVQGVRSNPPLELNYFIFMGNFRKNEATLRKQTPLSEFEPPIQKSWIRYWGGGGGGGYMYESDMHGSRIDMGWGGGGAPPDLCGSNLGGSSLRPGVILEKSDDLSSYCFRA